MFFPSPFASHCLIVSVIALQLEHPFLAQSQPFTTAGTKETEENGCEVIFFICVYFYFYCNSSRDLQLRTKRVYCFVHGSFCDLWSGK